MSISPAELRTIYDTFAPKLANAAPLPEGKTMQLDESSTLTPKTLTHEALAEHFRQMVEWSMKKQNTTGIDYLLWWLKKPSLPPKYKSWMIELMKALDALNLENATSHVIPACKGLFKDAELYEWDKMCRFACMDAARFAQCCANTRDYYFTPQIINRAYLIREAYATRYSAADNAEKQAPSEMTSFTAARQYLDSAKSVSTNVTKAEAGICTTFAWSAAHPLIGRITKEKGETLLKRVEVVGFTNHIFVVVNRDGPKLEPNAPLPPPAEWGDQVFQVDVWLGTLGHSMIYKGFEDWNAGFLTPTKSIFDSKRWF